MASIRRRRWDIPAVCFGTLLALGLSGSVGCDNSAEPRPDADGVFHVHPGGDIQAVLDAAALSSHKHVRVHSGTYRPQRAGQAFIWFNERHNGIVLEAAGDVVLTAANSALAEKTDKTYPAIVNHVVYFGDGIGRETILRGFKITGANGFATMSEDPQIQPPLAHPALQKEMFFYTDGGGIKVFGRSYPTIEHVEVFDNFSSPCGAGVSIEHRGFVENSVLLRDCLFRNNRCTVSGSAVDLLDGSAAVIENCLFVGNQSNTHHDERVEMVGKVKPEYGFGALTVFPLSKVTVSRCTFTGNTNAVDDNSQGNRYIDSIFWMNNAPGGWPTADRYELDVDGPGVRNCRLAGDVIDLQGNIDRDANVMPCADPLFDASFAPQAEGFEGVGYRPNPYFFE